MSEDRLFTELSEVLEKWRKAGGRWPRRMPHEIREAVPWWIAHQEPPGRGEQARQVPRYRGEGSRLVFPYVDRLVYTLRKFLMQEENFQSLIISAWEDNIPWRGDDPWMFNRLISNKP